MNLKGTKITYLGHSTILVETTLGKRILVDPWLRTNPRCPKAYHNLVCDAILITHGQFDHAQDAVDAAMRCSCKIVGTYELTSYLGVLGVEDLRLEPMNKGGTIRLRNVDVDVTMTDAHHSSSWEEADGRLTYVGEAAGYLLGLPGGLKMYFAGDTSLFGDMTLLRELYAPELAVLPIGDRFTMGPRGAAVACRLLGVHATIPCHYATFPVLTGTPAAFREQLKALNLEIEVLELAPGQSIT